MPIVKVETIEEQAIWGVWKIEEDNDFLLSNAVLSSGESDELAIINLEKRRHEWLAARIMLKQLHDHISIPFSGTEKDENKKPFLINSSYHISLAHCYPYAAAMIHFNHSCGIDIETPKPVLLKLAAKYLSEEELSYIPQESESLCTAWAAKEVLYKLFGKRNLSFKNNLRLSPFKFESYGEIKGEINLEKLRSSFTIKYQQLGNHIICLSLK